MKTRLGGPRPVFLILDALLFVNGRRSYHPLIPKSTLICCNVSLLHLLRVLPRHDFTACQKLATRPRIGDEFYGPPKSFATHCSRKPGRVI